MTEGECVYEIPREDRLAVAGACRGGAIVASALPLKTVIVVVHGTWRHGNVRPSLAALLVTDPVDRLTGMKMAVARSMISEWLGSVARDVAR
jgi:hypothetical protein